MEEEQAGKNNLIDTTDCLEAVGVFRCWKNFLFAIVILSLLLLQGSFWLVDVGLVKTEDSAVAAPPTVSESIGTETAAAEPNEIAEAAKLAASDPNQPIVIEIQQKKVIPLSDIKLTFKWLTRLIGLINFILIPSAILYCLTMLFTLKVSLLGRLGGINHIARAFFLSLVFVVLLLPWQKLFPGMVTGYMFCPEQLSGACRDLDRANFFANILHYLRFVGYWLIVLLVLIFSHIRSSRWARAILRRLEII